MSKKGLLKLSAMALALGLITGCATTDELNAVKAQAAKAQETADAALAAANEANANADVANAHAEAAMDVGNAAQSAADNCSERRDRMMKKAMAK